MVFKSKVVIWFAGLLVILGALLFWDQWQSQKDEEEAKGKNKVLTGQTADVWHIDIDQRKTDDSGSGEKVRETIVLQKNDDGLWVIEKPLPVKADQQTVSEFLTSLFDYKYEKEVGTDKEQWQEFGLSDEEYTSRIVLKNKEGKELGLLVVGKKAPVGYGAYLRGDGPKSYLGSQHITLAAGKTFNDFRDKSVLNFERSGIVSLQYSEAQTPKWLLNKTDNIWLVSMPEVLEADQEAVNSYLNLLSGLRAENFYDNPDPSLRALFTGANVSELLLVDDKGNKTQLYMASQEGEHYVSPDVNAIVMKVSETVAKDLRRDLIDFRNTKIFSEDLENIVRIDIDGTTFEKRDADWIEISKDQANQSLDEQNLRPHIKSLLLDMELAKTDQFLMPKDKDYPDLTMAPQHKLVLHAASRDKPPMEVLLWKADAGKFYLKKSTGDVVFRVEPSFVTNFKPEPTSDTKYNEHLENLNQIEDEEGGVGEKKIN